MDNDENKDERQSFSDITVNKDIKWSAPHENILTDWADKAMCYRWLHSKANRKFYKLNALFTIPVIIISTLTGTANFAQDKVPDDKRDMFVMIIGSANIFAGLISTIQQFLKITELNEGHRVSSVAWDKFYRNIKVELAKHPDERMGAYNLIKWAKEEFDRLIETSPVIPQDTIKQFKSQFKKHPEFKSISKPEICDELSSIANFKFKNDEIIKSPTPRSINISVPEIEDKTYENLKKFYDNFYLIHERYPIESEIINKFPDIQLDMIKEHISHLKAELSPQI